MLVAKCKDEYSMLTWKCTCMKILYVSIAKYVALPYGTGINLIIQCGYTSQEKKHLRSSK